MEDHLLANASIVSALQDFLDGREAALGKALPGTVVSYSAGSKTCSVQPAVHRLVPFDDDPDTDDFEVLPVLQNVPVCWPKGRNFSIEGTLSAGDPVLLVCMDRDISKWRSSGVPSEPADARQHSWASAVAIPGLVPDVASFTPAPTDAPALASKMDLIFQAISALPNPTDLGTLLTAVAGILNAVRAVGAYPTVPPAPSLASSASTVIKVSS